MIESLSTGTYHAKARQQLRTDERVEEFFAELSNLLDETAAEDQALVFEDFDIAQNLIPAERFEEMFSMLSVNNVHIKRFRAFGCPTLDDHVAAMMACWLATVTQENAPIELHLSDCAITSEGFVALSEALDGSDAFPTRSNGRISGEVPVYVRLEHNYIAPEHIQERLDAGTIISWKKGEKSLHPTAKGRLVVFEHGKFQQKTGTPPAPEDAPQPRPVRQDSKGKGKGKGDQGKSEGKNQEGHAKSQWPSVRVPIQRGAVGKGLQKGSQKGSQKGLPKGFQKDSQNGSQTGQKGSFKDWSPPSRDSHSQGPPEKRARANGPQVITPIVYSEGKGSVDSRFKPQVEGRRPVGAVRAINTESRASSVPAGHKVLRERVGTKEETKTPTPPAKAPPRTRSKALPYPWEEHWSDEFNIPYYWNSETGDSAWERPK